MHMGAAAPDYEMPRWSAWLVGHMVPMRAPTTQITMRGIMEALALTSASAGCVVLTLQGMMTLHYTSFFILSSLIVVLRHSLMLGIVSGWTGVIISTHVIAPTLLAHGQHNLLAGDVVQQIVTLFTIGLIGALGTTLQAALWRQHMSNEALAVHNTLLEQRDNWRVDFVALVAHEIKTPLTAILGFADILYNRKALMTEEMRQGAIERLYRSSMRLSTITRDLLDMSAAEKQHGQVTTHLTNVALARVLEDALAEAQAAAPTARFTLATSPQFAPTVLADHQRLVQVLLHLCDNAARYAPPDQDITLDWVKRGPLVQITVADHGPGISEEAAQRLFQPFVRGDTDSIAGRQGTGIGLYLCRVFIEAMGGHITVGRRPDGESGAFFTCTLPL